MRFFTRRSFTKMAARSGWSCQRIVPVGLPFDVVEQGGRPGIADRLRSSVGVLDRWLCRRWPNLFAFQFVAVLNRWEAGEPLKRHTAAQVPDRHSIPGPD